MIPSSERTYLRELARRVAGIAALPVQEERRSRWKLHNSLKSTEPMLLVFPEGAWRELLPEESLICRSEEGRALEANLRRRIYYHENFCDDNVIVPDVIVDKVVHSTGWGLEPRRIASPEKTGAWHYDPVMNEYSDLKKLRVPQITYDAAETERRFQQMNELLGDLLPVSVQGIAHVSYHLMAQYTYLRGLEPMLYDLYEEPKFVHDFLEFVTAGHQDVLKQYMKLDLLSPNTDNTYHSSGGNGWLDEDSQCINSDLPAATRNMWASAESQEFTVVSPAMHYEFALAYEQRLLAPFGRAGYGCCEDLTLKLPMVLDVPGMRRISISPFANVERCAEVLQNHCIYSWKPNPSMLVGDFDENAVRQYVRKTLDVARGCVLEVILKDTHTCENQPRRMHRWIEIAREEINAASHV
jgi:hypothetical protein